jgi:hypothetical protein
MTEEYIKTENLTEEQVEYLLQKQLTEGSVGTVYFQDFVAVNTRVEEEKEVRRNAALDEIVKIAEENGFYDKTSKRRLTGKPPVSKTGTLGSIPSACAIDEGSPEDPKFLEAMRHCSEAHAETYRRLADK